MFQVVIRSFKHWEEVFTKAMNYDAKCQGPKQQFTTGNPPVSYFFNQNEKLQDFSLFVNSFLKMNSA